MAIPLSYNYRNLIQRKGTTFMTAAGIAMTVAVLVASVAMMVGLHSTFSGTGHPLQAIVLRDGAQSELSSTVSERAYRDIINKPGIATLPDGKPMASPEMLAVINLPSVDSPQGMNVTVRGISAIGISMRDIKITNGRMFEPGRREVVVGASTAKRYADASKLGSTLQFGRGKWEVVGIMSDPDGNSAFNSEIWCDLNQVRADYDRQGTVSSILIRTVDRPALDAFVTNIKADQRLAAMARIERDYYASQTDSGKFLLTLGLFVSIIMAVGSGFGAMNTMYAAVARRTREIGTLRSLGFSRVSILFSFVLESLLLATLGGILGVLLALPMNNVTTGIGNFATFSEIAFNFRVGWLAISCGLGFALLVGLLGGFFPALAAARKDLLAALREI